MVALKSRAAAIADTYANQGSRAGAILPFTSALAGLCAAASAAAVEFLPFVSMVEMQSLIAAVFPTGAALFAAAASVSKARCEVDASAASTAAASGMTGQMKTEQEYREANPITNVKELIYISLTTAKKRLKLKAIKLRTWGFERYRRSIVRLLQIKAIIVTRLARFQTSRRSSDTDIPKIGS